MYLSICYLYKNKLLSWVTKVKSKQKATLYLFVSTIEVHVTYK